MTGRVVEASAPCRVDLGGGGPGVGRDGRDGRDASVVAVAIDRRVACRVEIGSPGVEIASKDALRKVAADDLAGVPPAHPFGLVARVLRAFGLERDVRVSLETRLPGGSGLGEETALAVALAGAVAASVGRSPSPEELIRAALDAAGEAGLERDPGAAGAARWGALVGVSFGAGDALVEPLPVDPARVEECLVLADAGAGSTEPAESGGGTDERADVRAALAAGRFEEVGERWAAEWAGNLSAGWPSAEAARLGALAQAAGGAPRLCGSGRGRVLAIWAPPGRRGPGRREAVLAALRAAGAKTFAARVDLRGLEVEMGKDGL